MRSLRPHAVFSSVGFTEAPVNTKQRIDVDLDLLSKVEIEWTSEIYLTEDYAILIYDDFRFLSFELVSNLDVVLNGLSVSHHYSEYEGEKYYAISGFNLSEKNKVNTLEMSFQIERTANTSKLTRIPWLFNENYAKIIHLPMTNIPVHTGNTSDLSTLKVSLGLPVRRVLMTHSGWVDLFIPPRSEWERYRIAPDAFNFPEFEYPIAQEYEKEGNTYFFKVHFSENNIASRISLVIIPDFRIPMMLLLFLLSPFYIPVFVWARKKKTKNKSNRKGLRLNSNSVTYNILFFLLLTLELYAGPLLMVLSLLLGGEMNLPVVSYIKEITHPIVLFLILIYPALFFFFFHKWKEKS